MFFLKKLLNGKDEIPKDTESKAEVIVKSEFLKEKGMTEKSESLEKKEMGQETVSDQEEYEIVEKEILPEKMICPDCGGITLVGLDFCDKCGGELGNYENY